MPAETASTRDMGGLRRFREKARRVEVSIEADIARLAEEQHGVVARRQLEDLGFGEDAVDYRIAIGRLLPVAHGVYAVGHRSFSPRERWMAAVLSSGPGAVLSHRSAAALWGIWDPALGAVEVTVSKKSRSSKLIQRHHSALPEDEVAVHEGISVTAVPRTILDLAAQSSVDRVENAIRQAEYRRLFDRLSLVDMVDRYPGRRGVGRLRSALARIESLPAGRTRSPLEMKFLPFLRRHRLPRPRLNDWITVGERRFQVDCHWCGTGQIVELDSWEGHGTRSAFQDDRARDRILRTVGYDVTRISWAQLDDEPEAVASDLRVLLSRS